MRRPMTAFGMLHFLHNLQMGPISWSVTLKQTRKTCQGQTVQPIGPNKLELYIRASQKSLPESSICLFGPNKLQRYIRPSQKARQRQTL
jgi:hypothetical protein